MCTMYWNLDTEIVCPRCKKKSIWNLQTHFMGEIGSFSNHYKLGENIPELDGISIILDGNNDLFCGDCPKCNGAKSIYEFGAEIIAGKVIRVWLCEVKDG